MGLASLGPGRAKNEFAGRALHEGDTDPNRSGIEVTSGQCGDLAPPQACEGREEDERAVASIMRHSARSASGLVGKTSGWVRISL